MGDHDVTAIIALTGACRRLRRPIGTHEGRGAPSVRGSSMSLVCTPVRNCKGRNLSVRSRSKNRQPWRPRIFCIDNSWKRGASHLRLARKREYSKPPFVIRSEGIPLRRVPRRRGLRSGVFISATYYRLSLRADAAALPIRNRSNRYRSAH